MEEEQQHLPAETGRCIPDEIVRQILDLLPLKSLARFECACKPWASMIDSIIRRRLEDEMRQRMIKLDEISTSMAAQHGVIRRMLGIDANSLRARRDPLKAKYDEFVSLVAFRDDVERYLGRIEWLRDHVEDARVRSGELVAGYGELLVNIDDMVVALEAMEMK